MRDVDGCSRLGVANFGHRCHHRFWKLSRMPFHGCPAAPSASQVSLRRAGGL
jgi:hypothetical protein